jgi:hypothetical protein
MGWVSRGWSLLGLVWISGGVDGVATGATTEPAAKAAVRLYDYAAVPYQTLAQAEREASRIFREAGVDLLWMQCSPVENKAADLDACEHMGEFPRFVVKILPETMAVHLQRHPRVFGMAVQRDAFIFFDRVLGLCAVEEFSISVILGHAMAHELGHMVLRQTSHSPSGIMMETFRKGALRRAEKGRLLFTRQQATDMRAYLCGQTLAQE